MNAPYDLLTQNPKYLRRKTSSFSNLSPEKTPFLAVRIRASVAQSTFMKSETLWHVSETANITHFAPRTPPSLDAGVHDSVVWAVNEARLPNYLLPRECPRVAFHVAAGSTSEDISDFFGNTACRYVIAVERAWLQRIEQCVLNCYALPSKTFECIDANAGYFVSRGAVVPKRVEVIDNISHALAACNVELRAVERLHTLAARVSTSSLGFSCIRMRNSQFAFGVTS
jgi:hypothetical protein